MVFTLWERELEVDVEVNVQAHIYIVRPDAGKWQCYRNRVLRSLETNVYFLFFHLGNIIITVFQYLHRKQREAQHHLRKVKNSEAPRFSSSISFLCLKIPPNPLYSFSRWISPTETHIYTPYTADENKLTVSEFRLSNSPGMCLPNLV